MAEKVKILVVDDEPMNVKLLEATLIPEGYEVITATNGQECLDALAKDVVDLVLLDVMMPGMDGFEVTKKIRADKELKLLPIVLITALKEVADRVRGIEAGCDDFISKPFDDNEVMARVKTLLKLSFYRRQLDEKEKFEAVIEEMSNAAVVCDALGKVTQTNKAARDYLTGLEIDADIYKALFDNYSVSISESELKDSAVRHKSFELNREETKDFSSLYLKGSLDCIADPDGNITSIILILDDISDEKKAEIMKQNFLGLMSHKLRTPVTVITGSVELLSEGAAGELNEKQKTFIDSISKKTFDMSMLVEKLLAFTTVTGGELDLSKESIELHEYLPMLTGPLVKMEKEKKVELHIDCPNKAIKIEMNKVYFDLIIGNLIENAIKFNDKDAIKIDIQATKTAEGVSISVGDNGRGVPPEDKEKVFDKFYQIDKHFTGNVEGAGLGLALVKRIVEAYGGTVDLESKLGEGSTFTFTIKS